MSFGVWQYVLEKELVNSFYFLRFGTRNNQTCLFVILLQRHQMRILLVSFFCTACVNSHYHYKHINIKQLKKRPIFFITVKTRHKQDTRWKYVNLTLKSHFLNHFLFINNRRIVNYSYAENACELQLEQK